MRLERWSWIVVLAWCACAQAEDGDLSARSKAAVARSPETPPDTAPFVARIDPVIRALRAGSGAAERSVPCADGLTSLCYDARERGVVYRGARAFMPRMQGFTPEGVALRRDRLILRYSFR